MAQAAVPALALAVDAATVLAEAGAARVAHPRPQVAHIRLLLANVGFGGCDRCTIEQVCLVIAAPAKARGHLRYRFIGSNTRTVNVPGLIDGRFCPSAGGPNSAVGKNTRWDFGSTAMVRAPRRVGT